MKRSPHFFLLACLGACSASSVSAATLVLAGIANGIGGNDNDEIDQWRSLGVVKTMDIDGDNYYGSAGYVLFATDVLGNANAGNAGPNLDPFTFTQGTKATLSSIPGYLTFTTMTPAQTGVASSYGYPQLDDPTQPVSAFVSNVEGGSALRNSALGAENSIFDITIAAGFPVDGIRLGMIFRNTDAYDGSFRLMQTSGGAANLTITQSSAANPAIQMAFFDITNATEGDSFRLFGMKNNPTGGNQNANFLIGGFTMDVIPEPGTGLLAVGGLLGLVLRRRRTS